MIHKFPNGAVLKFTINSLDLYLVDIEQGNQSHRIPLLLEEFDCYMVLENLHAIKWLDVPFSTFCNIISGFLSIILKYKSPDARAFNNRNSTPQIK
jgi:hypothetical protein